MTARWQWIAWVILLGAIAGTVYRRNAPAQTHFAGRSGPGAEIRPAQHRQVRRSVPLHQACAAVGIAYPPRSLRVEIRKAQRVLALYSGRTLLKEYTVALGGKSEGDKHREGDRRTPEGEFYVCTRLPKSRFHRFMGISYPAPDDARLALTAGRITKEQARSIEAAHRRKRQPPWNTPLGGEIGIHGGGTGTDWTLGCIALANDDVDELFPLLELGTPVTLRP